MKIVICILLFLFCIVIVFYNGYRTIYSWFDHYGWKKNSSPKKNAKMHWITSEKVHYGSSSTKAKLKTTVTFSDGFYFITHKTEYDRTGVFAYRMYISGELKKKIIESAIKKHDLAVEKFVCENEC